MKADTDAIEVLIIHPFNIICIAVGRVGQVDLEVRESSGQVIRPVDAVAIGGF